jgi:hypothetical protein
LIGIGFDAGVGSFTCLAGEVAKARTIMWIALPDAVTMYARFCRARYGTAATKMVRKKAQALRLKGDLEGHRIWSDVAREIEHSTSTRQSEHALMFVAQGRTSI